MLHVTVYCLQVFLPSFCVRVSSEMSELLRTKYVSVCQKPTHFFVSFPLFSLLIISAETRKETSSLAYRSPDSAPICVSVSKRQLSPKRLSLQIAFHACGCALTSGSTRFSFEFAPSKFSSSSPSLSKRPCAMDRWFVFGYEKLNETCTAEEMRRFMARDVDSNASSEENKLHDGARCMRADELIDAFCGAELLRPFGCSSSSSARSFFLVLPCASTTSCTATSFES
jgi:hypothetical protein